ncbi:MAG: chorismate mutase [Nitrospirae bacterium]|nr:chorismate mutase [Nitrospirota bacterium]
MDKLKELRNQIDGIDKQMLNLLNDRVKIAIEIAEVKKENNLDFYDPEREEQIIETLQELNSGPFPNVALRAVFKQIFSASLSLEQLAK